MKTMPMGLPVVRGREQTATKKGSHSSTRPRLLSYWTRKKRTLSSVGEEKSNPVHVRDHLLKEDNLSLFLRRREVSTAVVVVRDRVTRVPSSSIMMFQRNRVSIPFLRGILLEQRSPCSLAVQSILFLRKVIQRTRRAGGGKNQSNPLEEAVLPRHVQLPLLLPVVLHPLHV